MQIKYNPALDLCCAMLQYAHWDEIAGTNVPGYTITTELEKWYKKTKTEIPGLLHNDIKFLISNFLGLIFLPAELAVSEGLFSAEELIQTFRRLDPESLPERLFNSYSTDLVWNSVKDEPDKIIKAIEKAGGTTRKKEPGFFLDFIHGPQALQRRLADMMEDFYRIAIRPYEEDSVRRMEIRAAEDQEKLDTDAKFFFSAYLRINRTESEAEPQIFISLYNEIDIIQLDNPLCIIYGQCRRMLEGYSEIPLEQIYDLLADESRRTILRMLCRKTLFIREIADELELTSATISYHMSRLCALDLVTYRRGERKRVYYSADREKVGRMLKTVETDIIGLN